MSAFTTKPLVIEAVQFDGTKEGFDYIVHWSELKLDGDSYIKWVLFSSSNAAYFSGFGLARYSLNQSDWLIRKPGGPRTDYIVMNNDLFKMLFQEQKRVRDISAALDR